MARIGKVLPHCISKPSKPVVWPPKGGIPRPVKRGEMWSDVARSSGGDVLSVIKFNFGTTDPRQINWYLENYVKCTKTTDDRKNYIFDDGLAIYVRPGVSDDAVEFEILVDIGYNLDDASEIMSGLRLGVGITNLVVTGATWIWPAAVGLAKVAASGALLGAVLVPVASLTAIAAIMERGPKIMAQVAQAYTKTRWVYGDHIVAAPLPKKFLKRRFPDFDTLPASDRINVSTKREREEYIQAWQTGAAAMEKKLEEGFQAAYRRYLVNANKNGNSPRNQQTVKDLIRRIEQRRIGASHRTVYLNAIWQEMKRAEPKEGQPGILPTNSQDFNWRL